MFKKILVAIALSLVTGSGVQAQSTASQTAPGYLSTTYCPSGQAVCFYQYGPGFNAQAQTTLSLSATTANVALPSSGTTVLVTNTGSVTAYVKLGTSSSVTATTSDIPVLAVALAPNNLIVLNSGNGNYTYIAGITASSTSSITITTGTGVPTASSVSTGSITGTVTANQGTAGSTAWPVTTAPVPAASTNSVVTITTGGTFQLITASSATRKSFEFQNKCLDSGNCVATTDVCYIWWASSGSASLASSLSIYPGGGYLRSGGVIPSDALYATCDGTGDKLYFVVQ